MNHMTPKAARACWCPHARVARVETLNVQSGVEVIVGGTNRDAIGRVGCPSSCLCVADLCMSWRWATAKTGYCGLAGRPKGVEVENDVQIDSLTEELERRRRIKALTTELNQINAERGVSKHE